MGFCIITYEGAKEETEEGGEGGGVKRGRGQEEEE